MFLNGSSDVYENHACENHIVELGFQGEAWNGCEVDDIFISFTFYMLTRFLPTSIYTCILTNSVLRFRKAHGSILKQYQYQSFEMLNTKMRAV